MSVSSSRLKCLTVGRSQTRTFAVYAIGEGWTGALGKTHAHRIIKGHHDEEETDKPVMIYPGRVDQASAGWGSSAIIKDGQLWMIGKPQDFVSLLRLYRLPSLIRKWSASTTDSSETTVVGSMISKIIGWATGSTNTEAEWEVARKLSRLHDWTIIEVPTESIVRSICTSAGFSAVIGASGTLYTFGVNNRGQCGIGKVSNNEWTPHRVKGLTTKKGKESSPPEQDEPISQVALGLQHGFALSSKTGNVYSWGKAGRGQLGREVDLDQDSIAKPLMGGVAQVSSGMHHGAVLNHENQVFTWGKGVVNENGTISDARLPLLVRGLPEKKITQISCGSHHTAVLFDDGSVYAFGIPADILIPIVDPVELVPPGVIELPLRQFESHQDRTTIVCNSGQVFQVHLWKDEALRQYSLFTPAWCDHLLDEDQSVLSVHRGWLHTLIVTGDKAASKYHR